MRAKDFAVTETILDLTRHCSGYHILLLYLLVCGYTQAETARLLGISRQALNDELILIRAQYIKGRKMTYRESKEWTRKRAT